MALNQFLAVCLYVFAGCAALGLLPCAVLAAKAGKVSLIVLSVAVAAFVVFVLVAAAGRLT